MSSPSLAGLRTLIIKGRALSLVEDILVELNVYVCLQQNKLSFVKEKKN